jgi:hypothetical protein
MAYDDIALGSGELKLIGELWCPCRVRILKSVSIRLHIRMYNGDVHWYRKQAQLQSQRPRK